MSREQPGLRHDVVVGDEDHLLGGLLQSCDPRQGEAPVSRQLLYPYTGQKRHVAERILPPGMRTVEDDDHLIGTLICIRRDQVGQAAEPPERRYDDRDRRTPV